MSRFLENDSSIIPGSVPLQDSKYGSIKNNFASLSSLQVEPRSRAISILKCESSPRRAFTEPKTEINSPARNSSRRIMSTSRVRQSEYNYMTDPKNFRPILLQIGIERNSIRNNLLGTDFRIIVVQSVVRRHLVNRNFQLRYLHRENYRKTLNSELYIRQGDKPDFVPLRFLVKLYNKDLRNELAYLIESISTKKCDNEYNILFFLFRCMLSKRRDTLTAYEVSSFILNVLCYEFNEIGIINKFVSHPYFNRITFQDFYEWFKKNKSDHRLKVSNYKIVYLFILYFIYSLR